MSAFGEARKDQSSPLSRFFSYVKRVLVGVAALLAVAYVGDYLAVRVRIATNHAPVRSCAGAPVLRRDDEEWQA